jgi:hypothetical protein
METQVRILVQPPVAGHKKQLELTDLRGWFRSPKQRRKNWVQFRTPHKRTIGSLASAGAGFNPEHVLYCIVLYCIVLYCIVLYCIVLYCIVYKSLQCRVTAVVQQYIKAETGLSTGLSTAIMVQCAMPAGLVEGRSALGCTPCHGMMTLFLVGTCCA